MNDDVSDIAAMYNNDPEKENSRLERHQLEFDLTWRYLERYLPPQGAILEIGAATGRYTLGLARRGYRVTAVDLSAGLLEVCKQGLQEAGLAQQVQFVEADARDLSAVTEGAFDAVLLMGPLYHLVIEADRKLAVKATADRLRAGGVLVAAFISRLGIMGDLMKNTPDWIEHTAEVRSVMERGRDPDDFPRGGFRGYFVRVEEIAPLFEGAGFKTQVVAGVEPAVSAEDEIYNVLEGKQRELWLDLLFEISAEPSLLAASRHLLYIGQK